MNKEVTFRQIAIMYIFITISPILRQIPSVLAIEGGRTGYLGNLWSLVLLLPLTGILIVLVKAFPGLNIYETMTHLVGKFIAKLFILGYLLWILTLIVSKISIYALTLQFTLMPKTQTSYFMIILIILVYYALARGMKTVFRFSEFTIGPVLLIFAVLLISAFPRIRPEYLLPVSTFNMQPTIMASRSVLAVGGNIIIVLFFADKFGISIKQKNINNLWFGVLIFTGLSFLLTLFTFGVTGANVTAKMPFPFYITAKSISFLNVFERFEILITMISVLSDFVAVCLYAVILVRCFEWLFHLQQGQIIYVPLTIIVYYLTFYLSRTQFEFVYFYRNIMIYTNLIFQYIIPFFLAFIYLFRRNKIRKQY